MRKIKTIGILFMIVGIFSGCMADKQELVQVMECKECKKVGTEQLERKYEEDKRISEEELGTGVGYCNLCFEKKKEELIKEKIKKEDEKESDKENKEGSEKKEDKTKYEVCAICNKKEDIEKLIAYRGFGTHVHQKCYNSLPKCKGCGGIWNLDVYNDKNKNGLCDTNCDIKCTECGKLNNGGSSSLCNDCEWNKAFKGKARCEGCDGNGNVVDASLAGETCPYCGEIFKEIIIN